MLLCGSCSKKNVIFSKKPSTWLFRSFFFCILAVVVIWKNKNVEKNKRMKKNCQRTKKNSGRRKKGARFYNVYRFVVVWFFSSSFFSGFNSQRVFSSFFFFFFVGRRFCCCFWTNVENIDSCLLFRTMAGNFKKNFLFVFFIMGGYC